MRQHVVDIVRRALARGAAEGRWPALEIPFTVDPPARPAPRRLRGERRHGARQAGRTPSARAGPGHRRGHPGRGRRAQHRVDRDRRPRVRQPQAAPRGLARRPRRGGAAGGALRPHRGGEGEAGQRRVRLGQPHRSHARRPRPQRRHRRRRGEPARLERPRRHPRVLRQRLRGPGPDPGPLGPPPLPGAARAHGVDAAQELPGRLRGRDRRDRCWPSSGRASSTRRRESGSTSSATGPWPTCSG